MKNTTISKDVDIYKLFAESIHSFTDLPTGIWIPDIHKEKMVITASAGLPFSYVRSAVVDLAKESVIGNTYKLNKIQRVKDLETEDKWTFKSQAREMNWKSILCVPITVNDRAIGVISVYAYTKLSISKLAYTLPNFAKQISLALETERRRVVFQKALSISEKIQLSTKGIKHVLDNIVKEACKFTGADCAVLYPYDPKQNEFYDIKNVATFGLLKDLNLKEKPRSTDGLAAYVRRKGTVILSDIEKQDPKLFGTSRFISREKIQSFIGITLKLSGKILGILYVNFRKTHMFSQGEKEAVQLFAHQASIVINNANLYTQLDTRARALTGLHKVTPKLISISPTPKNITSLLKQIAKSAQSVLNADLVDIYQYHQSRDDFVLPPIQTGERYVHFEIIDQIHSDDIARVMIEEDAKYITDAQEEKILIQPFETKRVDGPSERFVIREKIQSVASIPLSVGSEVVGVLFANYRSRQKFTQQERELIELFAGHAAIAIYNARLFQEAQQQSTILQKLHEIGIDLVSLSGTPNNLRSVLIKIAKSAKDVLNADLIDLYQYFETTDEYDLPPVQIGVRKAPKVRKTQIQKDDVIWSIVTGKKPRYIVDSINNKELNTPFIEDRTGLPVSRFVIREEIKSTASVPLLVGKEIVGVLFANYRIPQSFHSQQIKIIELYAAQAAIAIHNSRLYNESLLRSKRLELVRKVAAAVSTATDIKRILQLAVNGLARVFSVKQSAAALFDEAGEFAQVHAEYLEPGCVSAMGHTIPLQNNPQINKIIETKKPLIIYDVQNDPIMLNTKKIMAERKTLSLMVVPIIIDNQVVGTIGVDAVGKKRRFTEEEAELAQAIANQAATTLRIAQQLDERLNDIHALQDITEQMHQGELEEVLNLIAERAVDITGAEHGGVWLLNKTRTALEFGGLAYKSQYKKTPPNIQIDKHSKPSFNKWVVRNKRPYKSGDVRKNKNYKSWYKDTLSELTVPIIYLEKVIGTINVESPVKNNFSRDHMRLLEAMAGQAAIVVQNARLMERLSAVNDIGATLTSGTQLEELDIIESIYNQVQRLTGAQDMYVALYDEYSNTIRFPLATAHGKRVTYPTRKVVMEKRGKTEEIIFTRKPIFHRTKKEAVKWYQQSGHEEKVGRISPSWLGVPILVGKIVLGVIAIYDEQEHAYEDQDLEVFSSMANQTAFALINQELHRRNAALASLNDVGKKLTSGARLREEEILSLIFSHTQSLTGAKDLYIALYNENSKKINFRMATEKGKETNYPSRKANMEERGKTEEIIFTRKPILHKTLKEAEEWYSQIGHAEYIGHIQPSWLGVPMMVGEKVLGVIAAVDLEKEYAFDELDLEFLLSMASQAAIALDNSTFYYEIKKDLEETNQQLGKANVELQRAQEREIFAALGEVAAGLIHKMSNTIGHVPTLVNRIEKSIDTKEEDAIRKLHQIKEGVSDALEYINSMGKVLDLRTFTKEKADSSLLINDALRQTRDFIDQNSIKVDEDYSTLPAIHVNPPLIIEVFRNIIQNAVEAMQPCGTLKITGVFNSDKIILQFTDNGSGILEENKRHLFNLGFSTKKEGKGIGLWFSRKVIEQHQGTISVHSERDKGTTFSIHLPVKSPADLVENIEQEVSNV